MRVALVAETFLPAVNGVVNSVVRAADHLAGAGHQPMVIAPGSGRQDFLTPSGHRVPVHGVAAMSVPGYGGLSISRPGVDLRPLLIDLAPDVIHLASPAVLGRAGAVAAQSLGIPSVAVFQTDLSAFLRRYGLAALSPAAWALLGDAHSRVDLTLAPSSTTATQLHARGIGPVAIWRRGVDLQRFTPQARSAALHSQLGGFRSLVVGCVGRLAAEKRFHLLEPLSEVPGIQLVVVGDGPQRRALQRRLPDARFLGMLTGADLARTMATFDVLVNPGRDETFCQVVQEALASGVPVVAAAAGGPLDLVRHQDNGWLWAGDDPDELAALVERLDANRAEIARVARRARASVTGSTWARVGDELIQHYRSVIASDRRDRTVVPIRSSRRLRRRAS